MRRMQSDACNALQCIVLLFDFISFAIIFSMTIVADIEKDFAPLNSNATGESWESLTMTGAPTIGQPWRLKG